MAVEIRLARHGRHKLPFYRIVVADHTKPRDGRYLELIGRYNTLTDPPTVTINEDRVKYWVGVGACLSDTMRQIVNKKIPGFLEDIEKRRRAKIQALRKKRKAKAGKSAKKTEKVAKPKKAKAAKPAKAAKSA